MSEILVIDTSTDAVGAALGSSCADSNSKVMAQHAQHSENILVAIDELVTIRNIAKKEISAVGVGIGPGMFTGLRVGITAANAVAQTLSIPLVYLSSLEIAAVSTSYETQDTDVIIARDARRNELYFAHYDMNRTAPSEYQVDTTIFSTMICRVKDEQLISPGDFVTYANSSQAKIVLDPSVGYKELDDLSPDANSRRVNTHLDPKYMINHVIDSVMADNIADIFNPRALYIRKSDAELSWITK